MEEVVQASSVVAQMPEATGISARDRRAAGPFVFSEHATCVRDSEGTYGERRCRLDQSLRHSLTVTKGDLVQRNIVQGVSVVRRGAHLLEGLLRTRPSLIELIAQNRLTVDYLDKAFPTDPADSVAPLADRIERVSLQNLLSPPRQKTERLPGVPRSPASLPAAYPPHMHGAAGSSPTNAFAPSLPGALAGQLDPAAFASLLLQTAMLSGSTGPAGPPPGAGNSPGMTGIGVPWCLPGPLLGQAAQMRMPPVAPMPMGGLQVPSGGLQLPSPTAFGRVASVPASAPTQEIGKLVPESSATTTAPLPSAGNATRMPARAEKPSLLEARCGSSQSPQKNRCDVNDQPPFVTLLDNFCDRVLGKEQVRPG